jgi:DNA-binding Lrp family transcriptional regulator
MDPFFLPFLALFAVSVTLGAKCVQCGRDNARTVREWARLCMINVDAFDLKILAALQEDGRLTNQRLSRMVGLSASQCSRRRLRLEKENVIAGYHAELSGEALGFGTVVFIHVALATHSSDNARKFRALVGRIDEIQEAYALNGEADYLLKAIVRDLKSLSSLVNDVLVPHQSVSHVRSSLVLERLKAKAFLPLSEVR